MLNNKLLIAVIASFGMVETDRKTAAHGNRTMTDVMKDELGESLETI